MPPENTRKPEVLRGSEMEKMVRNGLTKANSSLFVAQRWREGGASGIITLITSKLLSH